MPRKSSRSSGNRASRAAERYAKPDRSAEREKILRIIGGAHRGRPLRYSGDPRTRPMKDRVREAVFNLVGPAAKGKLAIDLFAGTGALGLEALSRGAQRALFIERHVPTIRLIHENIGVLGVTERCQVITGNTLLWARRNPRWHELQDLPWLVLCSPPYDLYVDAEAEMCDLIRMLCTEAPDDSLIVLECDQRFEVGQLSDLGTWDVREYPPATVAILEVP